MWKYLLGGFFLRELTRARVIPGFAWGDGLFCPVLNTAKGHALGHPYSLAQAGNWTGRRRTPTLIVLHLGSDTVQRTFEYFDRPGRPSSHVLVDDTGWYQTLPGNVVGQHAIGSNIDSVGIDVCQPWTLDDYATATALGYRVKPKACPRYPGAPRECLTLDERVLHATAVVTAGILYGYSMGQPHYSKEVDYLGRDEVVAQGYNLVAHAQVESNRADPLFWWPELTQAIGVQYKILQTMNAPFELVA